MNSQFKGIWIPKEIWQMNEINAKERCLLAHIDSLYDKKRGGCYASNEYLTTFLGCKLRTLQNILKKLKQKGLIEQVSFDGRVRVLKTTYAGAEDGRKKRKSRAKIPPACSEDSASEMQIVDIPDVQKMHTSHNNIDIRVEQSLQHTPLPPMGDAAIAASCVDADSQPAKSKKSYDHVDSSTKQVGDKVITIMKKANRAYIPPRAMAKVYATVSELLQSEVIDEELILKVVSFAANDNTKTDNFSGWSTSANSQWFLIPPPGKDVRPGLIKNFAQIHDAMTKRTKRKFGPSSDQEKALALLEEMDKYAK